MMKPLALILFFALIPIGVSSPAHADDIVTIVCTEIPMPVASIAPVSTDSLFQAVPDRNYASLVNAKAHPFKKDVYFVTCTGDNMPKGSERYISACNVIHDSFGQWTESGTGKGGQRFVWRTWNCSDVLFPIALVSGPMVHVSQSMP